MAARHRASLYWRDSVEIERTFTRPGAAGSGVDRRVVLLVAATASFLTPFMGSSVNIALPSIGREFAADAVTLSWITTIYFLAAAMFLVPLGRVADITGRRRVFLLGMIGYTRSRSCARLRRRRPCSSRSAECRDSPTP